MKIIFTHQFSSTRCHIGGIHVLITACVIVPRKEKYLTSMLIFINLVVENHPKYMIPPRAYPVLCALGPLHSGTFNLTTLRQTQVLYIFRYQLITEIIEQSQTHSEPLSLSLLFDFSYPKRPKNIQWEKS